MFEIVPEIKYLVFECLKFLYILQYDSQLVDAEGDKLATSAVNAPEEPQMPALEDGYGEFYIFI